MIEVIRNRNDVNVYVDVLLFARKRYEDFGGSLQSVFSVNDIVRRFSLAREEADFILSLLVEMGFIEKLGSTMNYSITTDGIAVLEDEQMAMDVIMGYVKKKVEDEEKSKRERESEEVEFDTKESEQKVIYKAFSDKDVREVMVLTIKVLLEEIEGSSMFSAREKMEWKELFKSLAKKQGFLWQVSNKLVEEFKNNKEKELLSS
jgi:hypothetical protein